MNFLEDISKKGRDIKIQPRPATWRKLEQRLDARKNRNLRIVRRSMGMVAALGLLIVASMLVLLRIKKNDTPLAAQAEWEVLQEQEMESSQLPALAGTENAAVPEGQPFKQLVSRSLEEEAAGDLQWLNGEWLNSSGPGQIIERWTREGTDVWQQEFDTGTGTFQAGMRLQQGPDGLVLNIRLSGTGSLLPYRLLRQDESQLIFENPGRDFPRRIAFRRLGPDHLSMVMYNPEMSGLTTEQVAYLQQSHRLQPQVVRKDLERLSGM